MGQKTFNAHLRQFFVVKLSQNCSLCGVSVSRLLFSIMSPYYPDGAGQQNWKKYLKKTGEKVSEKS